MSTRSRAEELAFREEIIAKLIEFTGGNPNESVNILLGMALAIMLDGYAGNREGVANHFEQIARGVVNELRDEHDYIVPAKLH